MPTSGRARAERSGRRDEEGVTNRFLIRRLDVTIVDKSYKMPREGLNVIRIKFIFKKVLLDLNKY